MKKVLFLDTITNSSGMKGKLNFNQRRGLVRILKEDNQTRLWFLKVVMELPLVYFHELAHYIFCFIFFLKPKLKTEYIFKTYYCESLKRHATRSYSAGIVYDYYDGMYHKFLSKLVSIAPLILIHVTTFFIVISLKWYFSIPWLLYITIYSDGWRLSKQDLYTLKIDFLHILDYKIGLLYKYKYIINKKRKHIKQYVSKNKRTI